MNIIIQNKKGEHLLVKRTNNPVKDFYWLPGGRVYSGETIKEATLRILHAETGLKGELTHLSDRYLEEIFDTKDFDEEDWKNYAKGTKFVHYLTTVAIIKVQSDSSIVLDSQSSDYKWTKDTPKEHPYLERYFELVENYL